MARILRDSGHTVDLVSASGGETIGEVIEVGNRPIHAIVTSIEQGRTTALTGDKMVAQVRGVATDVPKVSANVFAIGDVVYWDSSAGVATTDDDTGTNLVLGFAHAAAANGDATMSVNLTPNIAA